MLSRGEAFCPLQVLFAYENISTGLLFIHSLGHDML